MITNRLNKRELDRIIELFYEGKAVSSIAGLCVDDGREEFAPEGQAVRKYLAKQKIWNWNEPRKEAEARSIKNS